MSRIGDQLFYALTARDAARIRDLIAAVDDAISELLEYRCVRPLDLDDDFSKEARAHEQTNEIRRGLRPPPLDDIF